MKIRTIESLAVIENGLHQAWLSEGNALQVITDHMLVAEMLEDILNIISVCRSLPHTIDKLLGHFQENVSNFLSVFSKVGMELIFGLPRLISKERCRTRFRSFFHFLLRLFRTGFFDFIPTMFFCKVGNHIQDGVRNFNSSLLEPLCKLCFGFSFFFLLIFKKLSYQAKDAVVNAFLACPVLHYC
ncbi:hypothetical protein A8E68_07450 [Burkholderia cenocepacia]|uniref:Uncharacterized protein n=1 Tax=Burkholderia cenocepacia TaxID=95486 RepID=A0A1V2VTX3_9BURK|nr:hypothetical protein A8E67_35505 [Burkholderia cenocepacia]ONU66302.1 hypothetical protein A8E68_07450 [Burkholderia cenocepacia]ONU76350.1 hypothetical protein A8E72_34115 [Burkholderia cenocepacia]ONU79483.1 hypothetical protein A8E73_22050 [Burkholderia cenocepacia]ONV09037.1 hypothetical protein A8E70_20115 [Burkholderia cenocepacia]